MTDRAGQIVALLAAATWWVLASRTPTSTYHFAPMVVAGAWVAIDGLSDAGLTPRASLRRGAAGFLLAAATTILLNATGDLRGPVFWAQGPDAPVALEHVLFGAAGAIGGTLLAFRRSARPT